MFIVLFTLSTNVDTYAYSLHTYVKPMFCFDILHLSQIYFFSYILGAVGRNFFNILYIYKHFTCIWYVYICVYYVNHISV